MKFKRIKLLAIFAFAVVMSVSLVSFGAYADGETVDYTVTGGRVDIDFENESDLDRFDRYSEFEGGDPFVQDGALYTWALAEQKIIYKNAVFEEVRVDVDISTVLANGKIDSGIYIGASGAKNAMDGITAWQVNIEHAHAAATYWLKFHRFENDRWLRDEMVEIDTFRYTGNKIHLTVIVKSGMMYAFLNNSDTPAASKYLGVEARGMVGLRNYYAPCYFDNFTVIGQAIAVDYAEMNALKAAANSKLSEPIVQQCKDELTAAVALADAADTQEKADAAVAAIKAALGRVMTARTLDELAALIATADAVTNADGKVYTANSFASLTAVKTICSGLTAADGDYEIAYWYDRLDEKIKNLIAYGKDGE